MRKIVFVISMLLCSSAIADLGGADVLPESLYLVAHTADWLQTRDISTRCTPDVVTGSYALSETNPILGKCPSLGAVNVYFLATYAARLAIIAALPPQAKVFAQYVTIGLEVGVASRNARMGVQFRF